MTLAAGVAAAQAIVTATALPIELKWPNDLVIGRPWRKAGGVLCESVSVGPGRDAIVVGIGINVRRTALPSALVDRATSLEAELGRPIDRAPLVVRLMTALDEVLGQLRHGDRAAIRAAWRTFGRAGFDAGAVRWHDQERLRTGVARDISEDGALIVEAGGRTEMIRAGEVMWERLSRE
jgi:BirA family biotin operon repressor/biotin-[acetyl-CoA-carboxylase] ligase